MRWSTRCRKDMPIKIKMAPLMEGGKVIKGKSPEEWFYFSGNRLHNEQGRVIEYEEAAERNLSVEGDVDWKTFNAFHDWLKRMPDAPLHSRMQFYKSSMLEMFAEVLDKAYDNLPRV